MLWYLVMAVVVLLTFRETIRMEIFDPLNGGDRGFLGWVGCIAIATFFSGIISLVPMGAGVFIGGLPARIGVPDQTYPLVALREKDGFAGQSYFLGIGHIDSEEYYFWYRKNPDGSVSGGRTLRDECSRIYEQPAAPSMTTFKTAYKNPSVSAWIWIIGIDTREDEDWCPDFSVPAGTIQQGYVL